MNNQPEDLKQRKLANALAKDMQRWISRRWGRMGTEAAYRNPEAGVAIRFTQETFDCGFEILTVDNRDESERGDHHVN
jgi:hypothetical protein